MLGFYSCSQHLLRLTLDPSPSIVHLFQRWNPTMLTVGGGGQRGGFDALDYRKIKHGDAGQLGIYPILSVLPDKFARFLFEFHSVRFESLDPPPLPADRSNFDVHGALEDDKVKIFKGLYYTYYDT